MSPGGYHKRIPTFLRRIGIRRVILNILVCVKRVPDIGSRIDLNEDRQTISTKNLGFCISPHEECAVEEAIQLVEKHGGQSTVLTLGPAEAEEQIRDCLARGIDRGILIETDGVEWDSKETAEAIKTVILAESQKEAIDLILFGTESADRSDVKWGSEWRKPLICHAYPVSKNWRLVMAQLRLHGRSTVAGRFTICQCRR